jgi:hypothetical protein
VGFLVGAAVVLALLAQAQRLRLAATVGLARVAHCKPEAHSFTVAAAVVVEPRLV